MVTFTVDDLPLEAYPVMAQIRRDSKLCDVTIKVGTKLIPAHRIVLAATIPYFYAMFLNDMREANQAEIDMPGVEPDSMEDLVNFAYTGKVEITMVNVQSLLFGASYLNLKSVKEACCSFLVDHLHPKNVVGMRAFGDLHDCHDLVDSANKFIANNFAEVVSHDEFLRLSSSEVIALISRDDLYISSEEVVFSAVIKWTTTVPREDPEIEANGSCTIEEDRKSFLPSLLALVRLPLLTPAFLADVVAKHPIVRQSLPCRDLVDEAKDYHLMPERRPRLHSFRTRPRCCFDIVGYIYAVGGLASSGESLSTVEMFDPVTRKWRPAPGMTTQRSRVGVAVVDDVLYAVGGYDGRERLDTVEAFYPDKKSWEKVAPMNSKRSALSAISFNSRLYVCGGYDGQTSLDSVEEYDPKEKVWKVVPVMSRPRSAAGVAVFGDDIYVAGGHDGLQIFYSVEKFNPSTQTWASVPPMLEKRCRLGCAVLNGRLFCAGGYDGSKFLSSVETFDPSTNTWSFVAEMNVKRSRVAILVNCGKLFAIGGYDGETNLKSVECYDPKANRWDFQEPLTAHEGGVGVGLLPIKMYTEDDYDED